MRSAAEVERRCGSGVVCGAQQGWSATACAAGEGWSATVLVRKGAGGGGVA